MGVAEHKRRKNEACSRGIVERYAVDDYVDAQVDADGEDRLGAEAGRRRARADAVDQPGRHRLLQGAAGADDAQRGRRLAAPARAQDVGGRRAAAGAGGGRGGRARRLPAGGRGADDPADRGADGRPRRRRHRRHRRHRRRARGVPLGQPGARRRARATCPALVDATADVAHAAACLADSKAFDNSILCTNESVAIVEERVADAFERELGRNGAHVLCRGGGAARPRGVLSRRADRHEAGRQGRGGARGGRRDPGAGRRRGCWSRRSS